MYTSFEEKEEGKRTIEGKGGMPILFGFLTENILPAVEDVQKSIIALVLVVDLRHQVS